MSPGSAEFKSSRSRWHCAAADSAAITGPDMLIHGGHACARWCDVEGQPPPPPLTADIACPWRWRGRYLSGLTSAGSAELRAATATDSPAVTLTQPRRVRRAERH